MAVPLTTRILLADDHTVVRRGLRWAEALVGPAVFATADEAELMGIAMTSRSGTADAERLGVRPRAMAAVLGAG